MLRVLFIVVVALVLALAVCGYISYRIMKPQLEEQMKLPAQLKVAKVVSGEERFQKTSFYEETGLGPITEMRLLGSGADASLALVGFRGASFLGADRKAQKSMRFEGIYWDVALVDLEHDGTLEFLARGGTMRDVNLLSLDGSPRWSYSGSWMGVNSAAAGDADGDGMDEVAVGHNGWGGLHLLDAAGRKRWEQRDMNVWHVEILDSDGDGRGEIFSSRASGELAVRNASGQQLATYRPLMFLSRFSRTGWGEPPQPHLVACDEAGVHIINLNGQKVTTLTAPRIQRMGECAGTTVRFARRGTHFATLLRYQLWKRSCLYLHDAKGQPVYEEVLEEECRTVAAFPGAKGESLLIGCNDRVWEYSPATGRKPAPAKKAR